MIDRNLPNNEYQAAVNANNPSASNPFLTETDFAGGIGGSVSIPITSYATNGNAPSGIILNAGLTQLEYEITGIGGGLGAGKTTYYQFVVPNGYGSGANLQLVLSTSTTITIFQVNAVINGVVDSAINAQNIQTAVTYPVFEVQNYAFGDTLVPGDIITIVIGFQGVNGEDAYVKGLSFDYNIDIL
jgi:hypothetical protein